jgi:hypothetical protein
MTNHSMKKVLILTEVFPPAFNPRMGYLVKYLPEFDWDADIITLNTLKENNYKFLVGKNKIVRVDLKNTDTPHGLVQKVWRTMNMKRHFKNNKKPVIKEIYKNFSKEDYSVILVSVSWDLYMLDAGSTVSKKWQIPLIADIRDISEQKPAKITNANGIKSLIDKNLTTSFEKMKICLRNSLLTRARAVSSVSPFHVEKLSAYNNNTNLIYNGYDADLFAPEYYVKTQTFNIVYTGIVFEEREQDPSLLFEAVILLENIGLINPESVKIQFYTPRVFRQAILNNRYYPLVEKYIEFFDYIDYSEIPELLRRTSIALILTNIPDNDGPKGVITTKFFDYLGAERPVLCVRSDESTLESIINQAQIGVSARTVDEAYNFISEKWKEWNRTGYTTISLNREYKQKFTRKSQAKKFKELFESTMI